MKKKLLRIFCILASVVLLGCAGLFVSAQRTCERVVLSGREKINDLEYNYAHLAADGSLTS